MKFKPTTKVTFECKDCKVKEVVTLKDLPCTPKGFFVLPVAAQCIKCLKSVSASVEEKDE